MENAQQLPTALTDPFCSGGPEAASLPPALPATLQRAIDYCRHIQRVVEPLGYHAAIGGGSVHKEGERKDIDIILYRDDRVEQDNRELITDVIAASFSPPGRPLDQVYGRVRVIPGNELRPRIDLIFTRL
jgi:hypothetical protein